MNNLITKLIAAILALISAISGSIGGQEAKKPDIDNFRVTTYLIAGGKTKVSDFNLNKSDFKIITDVIIFSCVTFDEYGNFNIDSKGIDTAIAALKEATVGNIVRVYLNILGPDVYGTYDDWNDMIKDKGELHTKAFATPGFAEKVANLTKFYDVDGIFFDYEYPVTIKNWTPFSKMLVELDSLMGSKLIGLALSDWDLKLSSAAIKAVDRVEMMLYDTFDDNGNHSSVKWCNNLTNSFIKAGFDKSKLDYGVPFYARPSDKAAYWYDYAAYADKINADGSYFDSQLNKTFWFNTQDMISAKTEYAINNCFGGMMIWHYSCDLPSTNSKSLLKAMGETINTHKITEV